jgi:hypothetical protein
MPSDAHAPSPTSQPTQSSQPPAGPPALHPGAPGLPHIDVRERGGKKGGEEQAIDRRLFMQLLVFTAREGASISALEATLARRLREADIPSVVYANVNDPRGLGLLTFSDDPSLFVSRVRPLFDEPELRDLVLRPSMTMMGRSYGQGHEPRLEYVLLDRPRDNVLEERWPWAVWYPLRRTGAFAKLEPHEQGTILREHAAIGLAYGQQDLAHDVRLACHGLDASDNEFVVGLLGATLHPLSHVVQTMRKTRQTAEFIAQMGPFFVGFAKHRHRGA